MLTVAQAFERFMQSLELREGEEREAKRQERQVFDAVRRHLGPKESILSGSYGRNTAIRPLHDIDLFLIFPGGNGRGEPLSPEAFLLRVKHALEAEFRGKEARLQNRSVNIDFTGTGIGFDVVPAIEDPRQRNLYHIPDLDRDTWILSDPRRHQAICDAANERAKKKLKPLIKAVKRWNQQQGRPARSFQLEVMAYEGIATLPQGASYAEGMAHLFKFMSGRVEETCLEPAGIGPPVNAGISQGKLQQAQQRLSGALRQAAWALEQERRGQMASANEVWRELLGPDFPVR
ncbi:nucleotidyltransferase [Corallococcus exiguus]|uniref:nucleotidyltransferase domain-containing protein n=1 Tax=Corallococcus TaxID=83461 RepID=UPI000EA08AD0|nr:MULTISPECIES: nucleotidyltransferase [Corallococcus]NNB92813.1 nucleotidyltransferase [Corallococcus exiguus]NNC15642.1 nucleotidyltransferase [Corallococcus exiguus]NPC51203.1 nucleotidyltransferase [Corallococcus exiguus]RKH24583.1 nucleotidyltransferase [Corallococcus sp. CA041A]RKH81492.1 nucleotidyltransferase [Corallococcus sp. AB032C]